MTSAPIPGPAQGVADTLRRLGVDVIGVESQGSTHQLRIATETDARHAGKVLRRTCMRGVRVLAPAPGQKWGVQFELDAEDGEGPAPLPPPRQPAAPPELSPEEKRLKKQVADRRKEVRRQVRVAVLAGRTLPYSLNTLLESKVGLSTIRKVYRKENG